MLTYHFVHKPRRSGFPLLGGQHVHSQDDATVGQNSFGRQTDFGAGSATQEARHGRFEVVCDQVLGSLLVQLVRDVGPAVVHFVFLKTMIDQLLVHTRTGVLELCERGGLFLVRATYMMCVYGNRSKGVQNRSSDRSTCTCVCNVIIL